jgi:A/G-specific adenine glycosylase
MTSDFAQRLIAWQTAHGRHDLPWQRTREPYRIWLSEIMLQQTQVAMVIPYYQRFVRRFPDVARLAAAAEDEVLSLWSGLGYYTRARNLHRAAQLIVEQHGGVFPSDFDAIHALPGIGRSTAAAISVFAFGARCAILDGNVKRVLARHGGIAGYPGEARVEARLWEQAEALVPERDAEVYTQGLMDLGATVCVRSRPACVRCPLAGDCVARQEGRTGELPQHKPAKPLPIRQTVMLLLRDRGEILLEKRPPAGVWGGLWCFPEIAQDMDVREYCRQRLGVAVELETPLRPLVHTFTHFRLDILPQPARVTKSLQNASEPGRLWLNVEDALNAAIPAPVRTLLYGLSPGPLFEAPPTA